MTESTVEYWHSAKRKPLEFSASSEFKYWELLQYPDQAEPELVEGRLNEETLNGWFTKDLTIQSTSLDVRQEPVSGIRLLIGTCDVNPRTCGPMVYYTKEAYAMIEKELGLPSSFLNDMLNQRIRTGSFSAFKDDSVHLKGLSFQLPFHQPFFYQLALLSSPTSYTYVTTGLLLTKPNSPLINPLLSTAITLFPYILSQPSLLMTLAAEHMVDFVLQRQANHDIKVNDLEELMGQHDYPDRPRGNPLELDFLTTTRSLNAVTKKVAVDICVLEELLLVLGRVGEWRVDLMRSKGKGKADEESGGMEGSQEKEIEERKAETLVSEKIEYLKDTCRHQLAAAKYQEKRIGSLIQVVYQFMSQKDALINIELSQASAALAQASKKDSEAMRIIALETQKDSFAMKTIAVLGMFFLPGTFVAAIFAMPVYDWDGEGAPGVKTGFKYYWIVTAPLTVFVLLSWGLAMVLPWRVWLTKVRLPGVD